MKNAKKTSTEKVVASYDNELKRLLMADLEAFRTRYQFVNSNKQANVTTLTAA